MKQTLISILIAAFSAFSAVSPVALASPYDRAGGPNWRYLTPENEEVQYQTPAPPSRYQPDHQGRQYEPPRPRQYDSQKIPATGVSLLKRMIQLAAEDGGIGHVQELDDLRQRIDALPKPAPRDQKAAQILFANGAVAYDGGLLEDAARYYADARKLDPSNVEIIANLGFTYVKLGNLKAALEPLTTAATLAPGRSARWTNLAEYYARNGQLREAVACYALAVHFSRNPAKTVEFINKLAQDPEPRVQQAAQQVLQLSFVQSLNAPGKATLEAPLADAPPPTISHVEPQHPPQPVQPSPPPTPTPTLSAKVPEGSLQANTLPPNPTTVLDQPDLPSNPSSTPTLGPSPGTSLDRRTDIPSSPMVDRPNTFLGDGTGFLGVPKSTSQPVDDIKSASETPKETYPSFLSRMRSAIERNHTRMVEENAKKREEWRILEEQRIREKQKIADGKRKFDAFMSNKDNIIDREYYITTDFTLDMAVDFCKKHFGNNKYYFMNRPGNVDPEYKNVECSKDSKLNDSKESVHIVFTEYQLLDNTIIKSVTFLSLNSEYQYPSDEFTNLMKSFVSHLKIVKRGSQEEKEITEVTNSDYKKKREMNLHYTFIIEHEDSKSKYLYETTALNAYYDCFYYNNPGKYILMGDLLNNQYSQLTAYNIKSEKSSNPPKYISYIKDDRLYIDFTAPYVMGYNHRLNILIFDKDGKVFKNETMSTVKNTCGGFYYFKHLLINEDELKKRLNVIK